MLMSRWIEWIAAAAVLNNLHQVLANIVPRGCTNICRMWPSQGHGSSRASEWEDKHQQFVIQHVYSCATKFKGDTKNTNSR